MWGERHKIAPGLEAGPSYAASETSWPSTDLGFLIHEVKLNYTALQTLLTLKLYNSTT